MNSHSRMSGSRWMIIASWLAGSWRSFLYSSSMYACHLFLISSASVRSIPFLSYFMPIFACKIPLVSQFSSRDFQSFPFYCFPLFLCIDYWGMLSYLSLLSLELCIQLVICFLFSFAFSFSSFLSYLEGLLRQPFGFLHFFFLGMVLITASYTMSWTSIHSSSGTLSNLIPWIYFSLPL